MLKQDLQKQHKNNKLLLNNNKNYIKNSLHLERKYPQIFVCGHYLSQEASSELPGTDNVQGQRSEHIFMPNEGYCVYYPSDLFCNMHSFENWRISLRYSPVLAGHIW